MYNEPYYYTGNVNKWHIPHYMRAEQPQEVNPAQMKHIGMDTDLMEFEAEMPEYQLEEMYPRTYDIIYPEVVNQCDMFDKDSLSMDIPTREDINRMTDNIVAATEAQVEAAMNSETREGEMRQLGIGGRGLLRDLAGILLLREFFQRRHRPHRPRRRPYYNWH